MKNKNNLQRWGGFAAFYCGIAYIAMIVYFLIIVDYPNITEQADKIKLFADNQGSMIAAYLFGYSVFGLVLAVLSMAIRDRLKAKSPNGANLTAIYGIMWGTLLLGSGMIFITGINLAVPMYESNPAQAIAAFTAIEATSLGMGFSDGEIIGGLWTLLISIIALKHNEFNKGVNILGVAVGTAGILSIIPAFGAIGGTGIFGIGQLIWYIIIGVILLKGGKEGKANEL